MTIQPVPKVEAIQNLRRATLTVDRPARTDGKKAEPGNLAAGKALPPPAERGPVTIALPDQTYAQFIVDDRSRTVRVKIINEATKEVVREIPPEALCKLAEAIEAYQKLGKGRPR